ncbi:hypothetical protein BgiBS90_022880, partial [Biomphalaria glabrata]
CRAKTFKSCKLFFFYLFYWLLLLSLEAADNCRKHNCNPNMLPATVILAISISDTSSFEDLLGLLI